MATDIERKFQSVVNAFNYIRTLEGYSADSGAFQGELKELREELKRGVLTDGHLSVIRKEILLSHPAFNNNILLIERNQYPPDHHNTATLFQKGEINESSYTPGAKMILTNLRTGRKEVLLATSEGVIRDPEISSSAREIVFSFRKNKSDAYHIYKTDISGNELQQLTFAKGISDIDPLFLPDGGIVFSSTREPKYCMCNRHIMANLFRMDGDGANIIQIGKSTLFEGHPTLLNDGRILYDRWEYVDRNFGDAQGLWTVNPDGTNHWIYYGNNMSSPGAVIDGRAIPGTNNVVAVFSSCHDRPWGAIAIVNRSKGVDGKKSVEYIWPGEAYDKIGVGNWDKFMELDIRYEDPYPVDDKLFLVSGTIEAADREESVVNRRSGIWILDVFGNKALVYEGERSAFDPILIRKSATAPVIPAVTDFGSETGFFSGEPTTLRYLTVPGSTPFICVPSYTF